MSGVGLFLDFDKITLYDTYKKYKKGKERIQIIKEPKNVYWNLIGIVKWSAFW